MCTAKINPEREEKAASRPTLDEFFSPDGPVNVLLDPTCSGHDSGLFSYPLYIYESYASVLGPCAWPSVHKL